MHPTGLMHLMHSFSKPRKSYILQVIYNFQSFITSFESCVDQDQLASDEAK